MGSLYISSPPFIWLKKLAFIHANMDTHIPFSKHRLSLTIHMEQPYGPHILANMYAIVS